MSKHDSILRLAITGVLGLSSVAFASNVLAADEGKEQCAGVIKAGKNDCATVTNACHGHVERDASPEAWIYVPKGTCERIVGAHVVHVTEPKK